MVHLMDEFGGRQFGSTPPRFNFFQMCPAAKRVSLLCGQITRATWLAGHVYNCPLCLWVNCSLEEILDTSL